MLSLSTLEWFEFLSYLVTVLGFPVAIYAVVREMRAERANEQKEIEQREDELYVALSQQYSAFLESVLNAPELGLMDDNPTAIALTASQQQKKKIYYEMLIALFERAYILLYEKNLSEDGQRRWNSWIDYISWWVGKPDFRDYLKGALEGEDADFVATMQALIEEKERAIA